MKKTRFILPAILLAVIVFACIVMSGCVSADYNSLATKLQDEDYGYTVITDTVENMTNNEISGLEARITATKVVGADYEFVRIWYFRTEEYAIRWYAIDDTGFLKYGLGTIIGPANADEAESGEFSGNADVRYSREGRIVICGTAEAYADALS